METTLLLIYLLAGLLIGLLLGWLIAKIRLSATAVEQKDLEKKYVPRETHLHVLSELERHRQDILQKDERLLASREDLASADQQLAHLNEKLANQKKELEEWHLQMQERFELLAGRLLDEKSEKFTRQNREQMGEILTPLREKIDGFEKKVTEVYQNESRERSSLQGEIKTLLELNQRLSQEASHLAKALKGDTKKQGNWGELILERVLERSGLQKGQEYELQYADANDEGRRIQPDVVVFLPDNKHLIIDSKVSLVAYEQHINATEDQEKEVFVKQHLHSIRNHIKGLSDKKYDRAGSLNTPDFVLMFIPIESSFSLAVQADSELFAFAWDLKIVIVSPSTLLATLRTVASIWKQEKQTRNALEIARQAGALYDKFAGFVEEMKKIESAIEQAEKAFHSAMNKLQSGQGNLISRAERIRSLGIKTSKSLPAFPVDPEVE